MSKEDDIKREGIVVESLPQTRFRVKIIDVEFEYELVATLSGKMIKNKIKVMPGDKVMVEITPYNPKCGRIAYRFK